MAPPAGRQTEVASLPRRLGGAALDGALIQLAAVPVLRSGNVAGAVALTVAAIGYGTAMVARYGQTLGKMAFATRVVDEVRLTGPTLRAAALRAAVPLVGLPLALLGLPLGLFGLGGPAVVYGWLLRDPMRQGLHDEAAHTIVVDARAGRRLFVTSIVVTVTLVAAGVSLVAWATSARERETVPSRLECRRVTAPVMAAITAGMDADVRLTHLAAVTYRHATYVAAYADGRGEVAWRATRRGGSGLDVVALDDVAARLSRLPLLSSTPKTPSSYSSLNLPKASTAAALLDRVRVCSARATP